VEKDTPGLSFGKKEKKVGSKKYESIYDEFCSDRFDSLIFVFHSFIHPIVGLEFSTDSRRDF
jgi:hypothetical protein